MTKIKYVGKTPHMVAGKFMYTGDVRDVNPKIAAEFVGDADFVVTPSPLPPSASPLPPNSESANLGEEKEEVTPEPVYESGPDIPFEIVEPVRKVSKRGKKK
jgi:hypothetical protein